VFAIGEFARHGRVSVRMLRHYDAIGLLRPAHVDPATGYRAYQAAQLAGLNLPGKLWPAGSTPAATTPPGQRASYTWNARPIPPSGSPSCKAPLTDG
jgi:hypothetical protein